MTLKEAMKARHMVRKETCSTGIGGLMASTKEYHDYVMECLNKAG